MANEYKINAAGGLRVPVLSADPVGAPDGTIWYNSSDGMFRQQQDGSTLDLGSTTTFSDADFAIYDDGDDTKIIAFQASGITAGNTRTITMRDGDVDLQHIYDLVTLSGVAAGEPDLGTFTGSTIPDDSDIKEALQALETSVETKAASSVVSEIDQNVDDLISLSGVAENSVNLGTFTGSTIPDSQTIKQALQALETSVETKAADNIVIKKDGSVTYTANQPMGGFKLTGLGAGSTAGDSVRYEQAILASGVNAFAADQSMGGFKLTNLADPGANGDAVNLGYLNARIAGVKPKQAARAASLADVDIATELEDGDTLDGVTLATGDRVLLKDQADASENGIYIVAASGAASRSSDFDETSPIDEINGAWLAIQEGSQAGQVWVQFGSVVDVGTDDITFEYWNPMAGLIGGDMITLSGSTFSVDLASDAGLESSNPGNAAGQLRVKLDGSTLARSSSGLKVADAGITGTQLAASVAGSGLSGGAGSALSVNVDDSTIEINSDTLRVKDAGITDAKIATGIDAAKIGAGSVSNTEFGYLDGVTSAIQTQLDGKLDAVASSQTLTASQSSAVAASFTFAHASYEGAIIDYKIHEATTNAIRTGSILISTNGTDKSITDTFTETGDVGVLWDLNINGANVEVRYTTTANNKVMKATMRKFAA